MGRSQEGEMARKNFTGEKSLRIFKRVSVSGVHVPDARYVYEP